MGYELAAAHSNPDVDRMLAAYAPQNLRIVPAYTHTTADSQRAYITGMFSRAEQNCTYPLHMASAVLEMMVELQLHGWSLRTINAALHSRLAATGGDRQTAYMLVRDLQRECANQARRPDVLLPSVRPVSGIARALTMAAVSDLVFPQPGSARRVSQCRPQEAQPRKRQRDQQWPGQSPEQRAQPQARQQAQQQVQQQAQWRPRHR
eukprot:SAG22_NODE_1303_length_4797_cov_2976.784376_1_plen_206_part_00